MTTFCSGVYPKMSSGGVELKEECGLIVGGEIAFEISLCGEVVYVAGKVVICGVMLH